MIKATIHDSKMVRNDNSPNDINEQRELVVKDCVDKVMELLKMQKAR